MIYLSKAVFSDCEQIHEIQVSAFTKLLEKYRDYATNPASEALEKIQYKFNQPFTDYYFIMQSDTKVGVIRVVKLSNTNYRISPISIMPEFQNRGYAQIAMLELEKLYPYVNNWQLDTIKQESKLCYLYEKLGYKPTGKEEQIKDGMTIVYYQKLCKS